MIEKPPVGCENDKSTLSVTVIRHLLSDDKFKERHRTSPQFFTRLSSLSFVIVILLILPKSVKSSQIVLNEFFKKLDNDTLVTNSAFTQARYKLQPEAFIELNQKGVVDVMYANENYQTFWGFRILAFDGSKVRLPNSPSVCQEFGTINISNDKGVIGQYGCGLASVMYDVLNKVVIDSVIAPAKDYEVDLAIDHLPYTFIGDLLLGDRNYCSYRYLAILTDQHRGYAIRCPRNSFSVVREMFENDIVDSRIATLKPQPDVKKEMKAAGFIRKSKYALLVLDSKRVS